MKNVADIYALSPMQELMLFHCLAAPESGVLTEQLNCTLQGQVNVPAFRQAWGQVVQRHPLLRTAFVWQGLKRANQVVRTAVELPWEDHDWRMLEQPGREEQLAQLRQLRRREGFQLTKAPLLRCDSVRVADDGYEFIWTYHHLIMDGWCLAIIFKEVFALYEALCTEAPLELPQPRPYRDYIEWLRRQPQLAAEQFWRTLLQGWQTPLLLQSTATGAPSDTYGEYTVALSHAETARLNAQTREHGLTLSSVLQGALALVLAHASGLDDIVYGVTVSGRPADLIGADAMIGMFINNIPQRCILDPQQRCLEWLRQLAARQIELSQYAHVPLAQIQEWSALGPGSQLFDILLLFENYPVDASLEAGADTLRITNVEGGIRTGYGLTVISAPGAELGLHLRYRSQWFNAADIALLADDLRAVLMQLVARPAATIDEIMAGLTSSSTLMLVSPGERQQTSAAHTDGTVAPRTTLELQLSQLWEDLLNTRPIGATTNFFAAGGTSLLLMSMIARVQHTFGVQVPVGALFPDTTVEVLARHVQSASSQPWSPLVPIKTTGERPPFFCIHPVYGSALCYMELAAQLAPDQPFYGLQARGLEDDTASETTMEAMAASYLAMIRIVQPEGPYYLGGHCSGAIVAFEMAQQLQAQGQEVALLALLDTPPPTAGVTDTPVDTTMELLAMAEVVEMFYGQPLQLPTAASDQIAPDQLTAYLLHMNTAEQIAYFTTEMKRVGFFGPDATSQQLERMLKVITAIRQAYNSYQPQPLTQTHMLVVQASDVPDFEGTAINQLYRSKTLGWSRIFDEPIETVVIESNHVSMLVAPAVQTLAEALQRSIDRVQLVQEGA